jgi:hypothetical protein
MKCCRRIALSLLAITALPIQAQDTKLDKTKAGVVSTNPDAGRQHIQITGGTPPSTGNGGRPPMLLDAQIELFKTQIADLQALVDKQKTQLATLSSAVSLLQQDNNKLYAKAMAFELVAKDEQAHYKEYLTHQHNPGTNLGGTKQGNIMYVFTTAPDTLNNRTSGPLPGK